LTGYQDDLNGLIELYRGLITALDKKNKEELSVDVIDQVAKIKYQEADIDIEFVQKDIMDLISDCREGTGRIKKIVIDLKDFAHPGGDKIQTTDINRGLESTLNVVANELKYKATIIKDFGDIPTIKAYPQQLNQVFMNILVNAAQAIEKQGEIKIKTQQVNGEIEISIGDTGCGIPKENLLKIFDPFFTTKDVGKGTGLGMNIAYNIIKKHKGTIEVDSTFGKGTTFTIRLPVN
jgi:signal transduction histidine kinase